MNAFLIQSSESCVRVGAAITNVQIVSDDIIYLDFLGGSSEEFGTAVDDEWIGQGAPESLGKYQSSLWGGADTVVKS